MRTYHISKIAENQKQHIQNVNVLLTSNIKVMWRSSNIQTTKRDALEYMRSTHTQLIRKDMNRNEAELISKCYI
jgi:P pilus assembly chaperone PapD